MANNKGQNHLALVGGTGAESPKKAVVSSNVEAGNVDPETRNIIQRILDKLKAAFGQQEMGPAVFDPETEDLGRIRKMVRNAQFVDSDVTQFIVPKLTEALIDDICKPFSGNRKALTYEGFLNGVTGFKNRLQNLAANGIEGSGKINRDTILALIRSVNAFVAYDGILNERYHRGEDKYARLSPEYLKKTPSKGNKPASEYFADMRGLVNAIVAEYGDEKLKKIITSLQSSKIVDPPEDWRNDPEAKADQAKTEEAFKEFGPAFEKMIFSDNGKKMIKVILDNKKSSNENVSDVEGGVLAA